MGDPQDGLLLPPPVVTFLEQDPGARVLDATTPTGRVPQVAVLARDVGSLRLVEAAPGVLSRVIGIFLSEGPGAPSVVPRPEWPSLRSLRSRRARDGWWTVLRFTAPVDVAAVLAEISAQSTWGSGGWSVTAPTAPDPRVINPIGFLVETTEPVQDLSRLDLSAGVTPALVASLRQAQGVRVERWDAASSTAVEALALAGVPVVAAASAGPATGVHPRLARAVDADVDLADPAAREEHSLVQRRAAYDAVTDRAGTLRQPAVSVLLATRRADMLDFALAQVARQRRVARLELVLAPHGFRVDPQRVRDAIGAGRSDVAVQVLPQPAEMLFGDVLETAARAAGGDVVLKMDDDDWYAPDVVADLVRARGYSGAEMVGMPAELHYLTEQDLTVKRGHPVELYARFVAGGTMLVDRAVLREVGGFRPVKKYVDAQLIASVLAAGGAIYRTHGLGYVLRRNPTGHTWQVDVDYLLDPARTRATWPGFRPSRLLESDPRYLPVPG